MNVNPLPSFLFFNLQSDGLCPFYAKSGDKLSKKGCPAVISKGKCPNLASMKNCPYFKNIGNCSYLKKVCPFFQKGNCNFIGKVPILNKSVI